MAIRIVGGNILLVGGAIVTNDLCCCTTCCETEADVELFMTIDNFTLDGGETCDAGCVFEFAGYGSFGGAVARDGANFIGDGSPVADEIVPGYTLLCTDNNWILNMTSGGSSFIMNNAGTDEICHIVLDPDNQAMGSNPTCNPFYLQATLDIIVYDADGVTQCGTGTMRVTITE